MGFTDWQTDWSHNVMKCLAGTFTLKGVSSIFISRPSDYMFWCVVGMERRRESTLSYRVEAVQLAGHTQLRNIFKQQLGVHMDHWDVLHQAIVHILYLEPCKKKMINYVRDKTAPSNLTQESTCIRQSNHCIFWLEHSTKRIAGASAWQALNVYKLSLKP